MRRDEILKQFDQLNVWHRRGERAPHKPLLVLLALGCWLNRMKGRVSFREIDTKLTELLKEFGPSRQSYHSEYPFIRLMHDGIWEVEAPTHVIPRTTNRDAKKSELLEHDARGGFTTEILEAIDDEPPLIKDIVSSLLEAHFPVSLHADILAAVGLDLELRGRARFRRDPSFRPRVLKAYEYRCAVCGLDLRIGKEPVALDAAHIKWRQAGGPDRESNGFSLCVLHHKIFDLGAFRVTPELTILVSDEVNGTEHAGEVILHFHGDQIRAPQRPSFFPDPAFLKWHEEQVFKGEPRHPIGDTDPSSEI